jgi:hypothetical protein
MADQKPAWWDLAAGVAAILVIIDWLRGNRSFIRELPDQPY